MNNHRQVELRRWIQKVSTASKPIKLDDVLGWEPIEVDPLESADAVTPEPPFLIELTQEKPMPNKRNAIVLAIAAAVIAVIAFAVANSGDEGPDGNNVTADQDGSTVTAPPLGETTTTETATSDQPELTPEAQAAVEAMTNTWVAWPDRPENEPAADYADDFAGLEQTVNDLVFERVIGQTRSDGVCTARGEIDPQTGGEIVDCTALYVDDVILAFGVDPVPMQGSFVVVDGQIARTLSFSKDRTPFAGYFDTYLAANGDAACNDPGTPADCAILMASLAREAAPGWEG